MDLFENPFFLLGAVPRDNRRRIMELAEERSLTMDADACARASSDLTNPRKRLAAEVAWLPGVGPKRAQELLEILASSPDELLSMDAPGSTAMSNLLCAGLARLCGAQSKIVAEWIEALAWDFETIDAGELCVIINEERVAAGFPEVTDISLIESEIEDRRRHYRLTIKLALDKLPSRDLVKAVTLVVESTTNGGEEEGPILVHDLVDAYEVETQPFFEKETKCIAQLIEEIGLEVDQNMPDSLLAPKVDYMVEVVRNWDFVAQPIQVSAKSRGLRHDESHNVANSVRDFSVHLFNEHDKLSLAQKINSMLQDVFAEVVDVAEQVSQDATSLDEIATKLRHRDVELEEWEKAVTYETKLGLFGRIFKISPEGIYWKGRHWKLENIERIRWGGTHRYSNGIYAGTDYMIFFADASSYARIDFKVVEIGKKIDQRFTNITNSLWHGIGIRMLTNYLEGLRIGKEYIFGNMELKDAGVTLFRAKFLRYKEPVFCPWNEVKVWNSSGMFCIGKTNDRGLLEELSYQNNNNVHILEAAINMVLKKRHTLMSNLLRD